MTQYKNFSVNIDVDPRLGNFRIGVIRTKVRYLVCRLREPSRKVSSLHSSKTSFNYFHLGMVGNEQISVGKSYIIARILDKTLE